MNLLDAVDAQHRRAYEGHLWRVVREGRDPLQGGRSASRWSNGTFDVLYTSLEREGAIAEVHALLSLQPVFPSKIAFRAHRLTASVQQCLVLAHLPELATLGVDTARYQDREYPKTQDIADAAYFLGFEGLIVPSARWRCTNAVLFTDRIDPARLALDVTEPGPIDWEG
ncbi:MAG: RES family NAD+ phosphorylase, partial [Xanthobacteraceae bacterium]